MPSALLIDYLKRARASFVLYPHAPAHAAIDKAAHCRTSPACFIKVVMLQVDAELVMVALCANRRLPLQAFRRAVGARYVMLARERDFRRRFPRCEVGAIPPFGHLFGVRSWLWSAGLDAAFPHEHGVVTFSAGCHGEAVRMPFQEFRRLAHLDPLEMDDAPMPGALRAYLDGLEQGPGRRAVREDRAWRG